MEYDNRQYWLYFIDKLRIDRNLNELVPDILMDLCQMFGFGCGFSYQADHNNRFHLAASYELYESSHLSREVSLADSLGEGQFAAFLSKGYVCFHNRDLITNPLELQLATIFHAQSMVLVPITDRDGKMFCLVGLVDRRNREAEEQSLMDMVSERRSMYRPDMDLQFCRSILTILANYIKMQTYQVQAENARASLEAILDNMGIDVYVNDLDSYELLYLNHSMAEPRGSADALVGNRCYQALHCLDKPCDFCPHHRLLDGDNTPAKSHQWDYQRDDGAWFRVFDTAFRWFDGRMAHVASSVDITEGKRNEEIIRQIAEYDFLTGLPNRYTLSQLIDNEVIRADEAAAPFHLIFFDLDGFKTINDTMGHKAGDELLKTIAATLNSNPLTSCHSYRYGGDEFVVLVDQSSGGTLDEVIAFLQQIFSESWQLTEGTATVGASLGISAFPQDATQTGDLIRKADQAMYASKRAGKGKAHFYNNGDFLLLDSYAPKAR